MKKKVTLSSQTITHIIFFSSFERTGRAGAPLKRTPEKPAEACEKSACMLCSKTATRSNRDQLATQPNVSQERKP